jgi:hypothetical protein
MKITIGPAIIVFRWKRSFDSFLNPDLNYGNIMISVLHKVKYMKIKPSERTIYVCYILICMEKNFKIKLRTNKCSNDQEIDIDALEISYL